jgi:ElaB/YqjD/DUF883 family membrane-anchored ribosome-binding protein
MNSLMNDPSVRDKSRSIDYNGKGQSIESMLGDVANTVGKSLGSAASDASEAASKSIKASRDYVLENPGKGLGIAAAAGFLIGTIFTMATRSSHKAHPRP